MDDGSPRKFSGSSRVRLNRKRVGGQSWSWSGLRHDLAVGLISGAVVAAGSMFVQANLDDRRSDRETRLENLRFVRDHSSVDPVPRPFQGMDLEGQNLAGLNLEKASFEEAILNNARFKQANLKDALLTSAKMRNVSFYETNLEGAQMDQTNLTNAFIWRSNLLGASLASSNLSHALIKGGDFRKASLSFSLLDGAALDDVYLAETDLTGVCYTADTLWPAGFKPPPMDAVACEKTRADFKKRLS